MRTLSYFPAHALIPCARLFCVCLMQTLSCVHASANAILRARPRKRYPACAFYRVRVCAYAHMCVGVASFARIFIIQPLPLPCDSGRMLASRSPPRLQCARVCLRSTALPALCVLCSLPPRALKYTSLGDTQSIQYLIFIGLL
jgi:hypothetical protein